MRGPLESEREKVLFLRKQNSHGQPLQGGGDRVSIVVKRPFFKSSVGRKR